MERGGSEAPEEAELRLGDEGAGGVVGDVAEIGSASPMDNVAGADCEMAGVVQVKTCGGAHLELAVEAEPV